MTLKGIDVSANQGKIDWAETKKAGCDFVIIRSTVKSGQPDSQFAANVSGCQTQSIPFDIYKYTYAATPTKVLEEIKLVIALLIFYGIKCRIWWDIEDKSLRALGYTVLTGLIQTAKDYAENAGYEFGIYTGLNVYKEKWFNFDQFSDCKIWIARYYNGYRTMQFSDPADNDAKPNIGRNIYGWQYTSSGRIAGVSGDVDLDLIYSELPAEDTQKVQANEEQLRNLFVQCATEWLGCKESDGSHKQIIDVYNSRSPLPRGYKVTYTDKWCAPFVSAAAIKAGLTDIIPIECSCGRMVSLFEKAGRWVEDDAYIPEIGDIIFYDWDDNGIGDNTGWPDHAGIVSSVKGGINTVLEGNINNAVGYRKIPVNGKYIRGYGVPDYESMVSGKESEYYPKVTWEKTSISRALDSIGEDGSYVHRVKIAAENGINDYSGSEQQNIYMLTLLQEGKLRKA